MTEPTNRTIIKLLNTIEKANNERFQENFKRLVAIEEQTKLTNGRVTVLEKRNEKEDAVNEYKKETTTTTVTTKKPLDVDYKVIFGIISTLALAIYALIQQVGK